MSTLTRCPHCRFPVVIPNPPTCGNCNGAIGEGTRAANRVDSAEAAAAERTPAIDPLVTFLLQSDAAVAAAEKLAARPLRDFDRVQYVDSLSDEQLGLPPGTLSGDMEQTVGLPKGALASAPQLLLVVKLGWKSRPTQRDALVAGMHSLTEVARELAASGACKAILIHASGAFVLPEQFLRTTQPFSDTPDLSLMGWVACFPHGKGLATAGMEQFAAPNLVLASVPNDGLTSSVQFLKVSGTMLLSVPEPLPASFTFRGPPSKSETYGWKYDGTNIHLLPPAKPSAPSFWRRLLS